MEISKQENSKVREDQIFSPAPTRAKLLSESRGTASAMTENYRAPRLKALDDKLKTIISDKKNRLMGKQRSPFRQRENWQGEEEGPK
jgi:hypothetical protein